MAGSGSGSEGQDVTFALAGAGSSATNTIDNTIAASITNCSGTKSVVANGGGVSLTASDDTSVRADSGGYAVAIAASEGGGGQGAGAPGGLGIERTPSARTAASRSRPTIDNSMVNAAGDVTLGATSTATASALGMGGAGAGAGAGGTGITISPAAAGAGTYNTLQQTIAANIKDGSTVTTTNSATSP